MAARKFDADVMLQNALEGYDEVLNILIARTALWANPAVHEHLLAKGTPAKCPKVRRMRISRGERRGDIIDGIRLDDNTYANNAIKWAIGVGRKNIRGYETCHIWEDTCYDERYHTVIANLVLLPRPLAALTDHYAPTQNILKYRAYELYKWHPDEHATPVKPDGYVSCWREPEPIPDILMRKAAGWGR